MTQPFEPEPEEAPGEDGVTLSTTPVPLRVEPIDDDRVPPGQAGLGAWLGGRLVARNSFPAELVARLPLDKLFGEPVSLVFRATTGGPGVQGTLFAAVPAELLEEDREAEEPWAASVPRFEDAEGSTTEDSARALFPLGMLVRVERDRKHPGNLALEAADLLQTALTGRVHEVIDRVLDDLLND